MKPMKYKRIVVTKRGPPENLQITECDLRDPSAQEVRVKYLVRHPWHLPNLWRREVLD